MKLLLSMAWRNLWRHGRRTALTAGTVALGLAMLLVFLGLGDGSHAQMIDSAVRLGSGHIVFQALGYQELGGLERTMVRSQTEPVVSWLAEKQEDYRIEGVVPRIFASALASSASGSSGVFLMGMQPGAEGRVSKFSTKVSDGEFLGEGQCQQIVMGEGVARKLKVRIGDKVVLMAQAARSPDIESSLMRVGGILTTSQENLDQTVVLAPLDAAQDFFKLNDQLHQLAVLLPDESDSLRLAAEARAAFPDLEVLSWQGALPELHDFIQVDDGGNYVFHVFLFLLIAFLVLNTLLMSVLERRKEFTFLDAIGLNPQQRFGLVMLEAFFIASLSCLLGFVIGYSGNLYLEIYGLPLRVFNMEAGSNVAGVAFDPVMYSKLSWGRIAQSLGAVFAMTFLLALWPARRAAAPGNVQLLASGR